MQSGTDEDRETIELRIEPRELPRRRHRSRMWIAALALAAFAAFSWYAYRQATKTGEQAVAPLIKAEEGPTRVKPEEPGGMEVPHQDKGVYERLGSEESKPTEAETLLPPPEAPLPPPEPPAPPSAAPIKKAAAPPPPGAGTAPEAAAQPAPTASPPAAAAPPTPAAPPAPPASAETQAAAAPPPAPAAKPASGPYRVQLASLRSQEDAEKTWSRLVKANADLLGELGHDVVRADLGEKGVFYRLQAGALSESAAKSLCAELKGRKAECIVVRP